MAYEFNPASSQSLTTVSTPVVAAPFTLVAWAKVANTNANKGIIALESTVNNHAFSMYLAAGAANGILSYFVRDVNGFSQPQGLTPQANTWTHYAAVERASNNRAIYFNGMFDGGNTITRTPSSINKITIGSTMNGAIAEVAIYDVDLTNAEIASLAKGITCNKIRPENLRFYTPLIRNLQDVRGGLNINNNNGATVANHPRIYK